VIPESTRKEIAKLYSAGWKVGKIADKFGISKSTVINYVGPIRHNRRGSGRPCEAVGVVPHRKWPKRRLMADS
jgi:transposase